MKRIFLILILCLSYNSFGQANLELVIRKNLEAISLFMQSELGNSYFKNDFDVGEFSEVSQKAHIIITSEKLTDKFGATRCALNFPSLSKIIFNEACLLASQNNATQFFTLISHEILNLMGKELPDATESSIYPISIRIGEASGLILKLRTNIILNKTCNLDVRNLSLGLTFPMIGYKILRDKGFKDVNYEASDKFNEDHVKLVFRLRSRKLDKYTLTSTVLSLSDASFQIDDLGQLTDNKDGLLIGLLDDTRIVTLIPANLKERVGIADGPGLPTDEIIRTNDEGKTYYLELKEGYKRELFESLVKFPECVIKK